MLQVISSIDSIQKVYAALGIRYREDGSQFGTSRHGIGTSFKMPLSEMSDRRLRNLLELLELPIMTILNAFHQDTEGLMLLLAGKVDSGQKIEEHLKAALADLPIVKDIVTEINATTDHAEETRLLSLLSQQFSLKDLNQNLGLKNSVSKRR